MMTMDLVEIAEKQFSSAVRGWNREEVKAYLAEIAAGFVPVLQDLDNTRLAKASGDAEAARLRADVERLTLEIDAYRSQRARTAQIEASTLSDVGSQLTAILEAAAATGARIRENAERHATNVRRKALDEAAVIDEECQAVYREVSVARQEAVGRADNLWYLETELRAAGHTAQREVADLADRIAEELHRLQELEAHYGTRDGAGEATPAEIAASLQGLREVVLRADWPLPEDLPAIPSELGDDHDATTPAFALEPLRLAAKLKLRAVDEVAEIEHSTAALLSAGRPVATEYGAQPDGGSARARVAVLGAGYVGLTTAACLAHLGHTVACTDLLRDRVEELSQGRLPLMEHGLESLLREGLATDRLSFSADNALAVVDADVVFLCLPTPEGPDGRTDMAAAQHAVQEIGPRLREGAIVIDKSTAPVGSCRQIASWIGRTDVSVVSNPEFLREGSAVTDFLHPDRVVIGADDPRVAARVAALYRSIETEVLIMAPESAELVKYVSNAFLATKLSYVNFIATLCELVGADVDDVVKGMGTDRRVGPLFLSPGPGWGGSCFPKDTEELRWIARDAGLDFRILDEVIASNQAHEIHVADRIEELAGGTVEGQTIAVWGLTFKARTDDQRESPALAIIARLRERGATIQAYDPTVSGPVPGVQVCLSAVAACEGASVLFVATEWEELRHVDLALVRQVMRTPAIVDARHLLDPTDPKLSGFTYAAVGRPVRPPVDSAGVPDVTPSEPQRASA